MNKVLLIGRLTRDPEVRYSQGADSMAIARYTLAIDRPKKDGESAADFISCVALGKSGEFAEKYLRKGTKIAVEGSIRTGSYTNKDGQKVYTTDVLVSQHEFCESRGMSEEDKEARDNAVVSGATADANGFMNIPDGIEEELPFM